MDPTGFVIAKAAATKSAEFEAAAAKSAEFEAAAAQSAEFEAAATKPAADDFRSFDTAFADSLIDKKKWDDLVSYLSSFMDLNDHPGLKFFIIERQVLEHVQAKGGDKGGDAMGLVLRQVLPLCFCEEASDFIAADLSERAIDFIPADLAERAAKLSERALQMNKQSTSRGVEDDEESDLKTAICDYMRLYLPTTIRFDNKRWEGTLGEFYHICKDNTHALRYRCLLCQWIIPASHDAVTIARNHLWHKGLQKHCSRLTANVVRRIQLSPLSEVIEEVTVEENCMSKSAPGSSDSSSSKKRKRKAEVSYLSHDESLYQVGNGKSVRKLLSNMKDIVASLIWDVVTYCRKVKIILQNDKSENAMEIKRLCYDCYNRARNLYYMYYDARIGKTPLAYKVFKEEVEGMMDVNFNQLLPLLCRSSSGSREGEATRELVYEMDAALCRLRALQIRGDHGLDDD